MPNERNLNQGIEGVCIALGALRGYHGAEEKADASASEEREGIIVLLEVIDSFPKVVTARGGKEKWECKQVLRSVRWIVAHPQKRSGLPPVMTVAAVTNCAVINSCQARRPLSLEGVVYSHRPACGRGRPSLSGREAWCSLLMSRRWALHCAMDP